MGLQCLHRSEGVQCLFIVLATQRYSQSATRTCRRPVIRTKQLLKEGRTTCPWAALLSSANGTFPASVRCDVVTKVNCADLAMTRGLSNGIGRGMAGTHNNVIRFAHTPIAKACHCLPSWSHHWLYTGASKKRQEQCRTWWAPSITYAKCL